ncbi:MAG: hypothetical protein K2X90_00950 [Candidatus Babeliaceae bacterium]|nr:hypothetical protein [Candidatus Babeliaceae bacterium]
MNTAKRVKGTLVKKLLTRSLADALPQTEDAYRELADGLVSWARRDDAIQITDFASMQLIAPSNFAEFAAKSEYFKNAYEIAKTMVGSRRERLALAGKLHPGLVMATMPLYDKDYRIWLLRLRHKQENPEPQPFVIVFDDYQNPN